MEIRALHTAAWPQWDAYIRGAAGGLPQHLAGWQSVLALTYGYTTHYLGAWVADPNQAGAERLVGALPLFTVDSPLLGQVVIAARSAEQHQADPGERKRLAAAIVECDSQLPAFAFAGRGQF